MLRPHTVLGSYEILGVLGAGGMGEVYRARDRRLDREVAIKVLPDALAADPERLARFQREARVLASLNHANIATLHGFESAVPDHGNAPAGVERPPIPFLIMEVVAGETLAEVIARGPLALEQAVPIFLQIAEALESAHERGVIHRDLKPANIKVSPDGVVKLLDFGLAKTIAMQASTSEPQLSNSPTVSLAATRHGEIMGTATYMAPEQARGQAVDRRADVWAFGACLFEALVGRRAFDGDTVSDALALILRGEPDWKALPAATPRPLLELLRRCLEKAPRERLRDIGEARIVIAKLRAGGYVESAGEEPPSARSPALRRGWAWAAAGLLGGVIVGGLAVRGLRSPAPEKRTPTRFTIVAPDGERFRDLSDLAISPDGRHLVYRRAPGSDTGFTRSGLVGRLYHRPLDAFDTAAVELPNTEGALYPFFSPDGEWVGYYLGPGGRRTLRRVRLDGGLSTAITTEPHSGFRATWAPSGDVFLGNQRLGLQRVAKGGAKVEWVPGAGGAEPDFAYLHPHALPGGKALLFTAFRPGDEDFEVAVFDLEAAAARTLLPAGSDARYAASGHLLYVHGGELRAVAFDRSRLEVVGETFPLVPRVRTDSLGAALFAIADNGTLVYVPEAAAEPSEMSLVRVDRRGQVTTTLAAGDYVDPAVSFDGRRVAAIDDRSSGLYVFETGSPAARIVAPSFLPMRPLWSRDDQSLFFGTRIPGAPVLHRVSADGAVHAPEPVAGAHENRVDAQFPFAVSPDGRELLFGEIKPSRSDEDLEVLSLDGGPAARRPFLATAFDEGNARLSADGDLVAYVSDREGTPRVYVTAYAAPDRHVVVSEGESSLPRWSRAGRELFYVSDGSLWSANVEAAPQIRASERRALFALDGFLIHRGYDTDPEGGFVMARENDTTSESPAEAGRIHVVLDFFAELERLGAAPGER